MAENPIYGIGVGGHLTALLKKYHISLVDDYLCDCREHAELMDLWGPDECEKRSEEIVNWLLVSVDKASFMDFQISWVPMIALEKSANWLLDEAIRRTRIVTEDY